MENLAGVVIIIVGFLYVFDDETLKAIKQWYHAKKQNSQN
jgi:hypothetical protein